MEEEKKKKKRAGRGRVEKMWTQAMVLCTDVIILYLVNDSNAKISS